MHQNTKLFVFLKREEENPKDGRLNTSKEPALSQLTHLSPNNKPGGNELIATYYLFHTQPSRLTLSIYSKFSTRTAAIFLLFTPCWAVNHGS
jgi:hypothetical protein